MFKLANLLCIFTILSIGCTPPQLPPPTWNENTDASENEYAPYMKEGTGILTGQAFMSQKNGGTVKGAGSNVTLDPATTVGHEWWAKAGTQWVHRGLTPPSANFHKLRRTTVADADGRFEFRNLPAGKYYVRTEVTWNVPYLGIQGGLVGRLIEVKETGITDVILNQFPQ